MTDPAPEPLTDRWLLRAGLEVWVRMVVADTKRPVDDDGVDVRYQAGFHRPFFHARHKDIATTEADRETIAVRDARIAELVEEVKQLDAARYDKGTELRAELKLWKDRATDYDMDLAVIEAERDTLREKVEKLEGRDPDLPKMSRKALCEALRHVQAERNTLRERVRGLEGGVHV